MTANFSKRCFAYLFDVTFLIIFLAVTSSFVLNMDNQKVLNDELTTIENQFLDDKISLNTYLNQASSVYHEMDKERVMVSILNIMYILIYFIVIPFNNKGQTYGKKMVGIKVVREDKEELTLNDLIYRNLFINGLGYMLICLSLVYLIPSFYYFITSSILSFIQIVLVFTSIFMILYRHDKKGLHDLWTKTKVVIDKK
ncbi:MAG: RDD family protein [Ignavibacteriales bacterium]